MITREVFIAALAMGIVEMRFERRWDTNDDGVQSTRLTFAAYLGDERVLPEMIKEVNKSIPLIWHGGRLLTRENWKGS